MKQRQILFGCGAMFLIGLMLVCTFSAGIVLGERGIARAWATQVSRGTIPPNLVLEVGTPNVIGTVQRYADNAVTLRTAEGLRSVAVDGKTVVRYQNNKAGEIADLRLDAPVAVWGDNIENGRVLLARTIVILAPGK